MDNKFFDFSIYTDNELLKLATINELNTDFNCVQLCLEYAKFDELKQKELDKIISASVSLVLLFEEELKKRNILKKYRESIQHADYSEGNFYTYNSYSFRLAHLMSICNSGKVTEDSLKQFICTIQNSQANTDKTPQIIN